jgi:uncharacterized protein (DUF983 family)
MSDAPEPKFSFMQAALGTCPVCGKGKLFTSYLKVAKACQACGTDFSKANPGDGPVVMVIMLAGLVACSGLAVSLLAWNWSPVLILSVWPAVAIAVCLVLMPMLKGLMVASQIKNSVTDR